MPDNNNLFIRFLTWFGSSRAGAWTIINLGTNVDRWLIRATSGKFNSTLAWPCLLLTTIGAKSGMPRTVSLVYIEDGEGYALIASRGGNLNHPAWYINLKANPEAEILVNGRTITCIAHEAEAEQRERLWSKALEMYRGYDTYQKRAGGRKIPVIILTPES